MEILDNMPHDRLFADENGEFTLQSEVEISKEGEKEVIKEIRTAISEMKDS
jgi:hypothetical protein